MEIASPGKINLTLDIKGLGADGFHEIESVMQTFDFCDYLQFTLEDEGLRMSCSQVDPADLFLIRYLPLHGCRHRMDCGAADRTRNSLR